MRIRKLLIGFSKLSDAALLAFAQAVLAAMTGNTNFPTPQPTLVVFGAAITAFEDAMAAAAGGGLMETAVKNQQRVALIVLLKQLASYVTLVSDNDEAKMLSSAFELSKDPSPIGPLAKPSNFEMKPAEKGQVKLSLDAVYGARLYQFEYKPVTATEWILIPSTSTKLMLTDLESGKEYVGRVVPLGASKIRTYSDSLTCFVN
jgi:hypothetical protein